MFAGLVHQLSLLGVDASVSQLRQETAQVSLDSRFYIEICIKIQYTLPEKEDKGFKTGFSAAKKMH